MAVSLRELTRDAQQKLDMCKALNLRAQSPKMREAFDWAYDVLEDVNGAMQEGHGGTHQGHFWLRSQLTSKQHRRDWALQVVLLQHYHAACSQLSAMDRLLVSEKNGRLRVQERARDQAEDVTYLYEQHLADQAELAGLKYQLFKAQEQLQHLAADAEEREEAAAVRDGELEAAHREAESLRTQLAEAREMAAYQAQELTRITGEFESTAADHEREVSHLESQLEAAGLEAESLREQLAEAREMPDYLSEELSRITGEYQSTVADYKKEVKWLEAQLEAEQWQLRFTEAKLEEDVELREEVAELQAQLAAEREAGAGQEAQAVQAARLAENRARQRAQERKMEAAETLGKAMALQQELWQAEDRQRGLQEEVAALQGELAAARSAAERFEGEVASLRHCPELQESQLVTGNVLGEGTFGRVVEVTYAYKMVKPNAPASHRDMLIDEGRALRRLPPHPNLARLAALVCDHEERPTGLLLQKCRGGSLDSFLLSPLFRSWETLKQRAFCLNALGTAVEGLLHMLEHGYVHGDVKPPNILLTEKFHAVVTDLGGVRQLDPRTGRTMLSCFTSSFCSPEAKESGYVTAKEDVYALGCMMGHVMEAAKEAWPALAALRGRCLQPEAERPTLQQLRDDIVRLAEDELPLVTKSAAEQ